VVLDNRGLAASTGSSARPAGRVSTICCAMRRHETLPQIDFEAHARSLGAVSEKVTG
jgi:3D-(3,5/4)-trihydroxycyclohexane-1,2-dione acylhydrolase (decyclizing)